MPEVPVGYGQLTALISLAGDQEIMSTGIGLRFDDADAVDQTLVNAYSTTFSVFLKGAMANVYSYEGLNLFIGTTLGDRSFDSSTGAGVGTAGVAPLPQNTSALVRKSSGFAGRKNRGRMFIPGIREANVGDNGELSGAEITRLQTLVDSFMSTMLAQASILDLVILHSFGDATEPTVITAMTVDGIVATQRRRLRR